MAHILCATHWHVLYTKLERGLGYWVVEGAKRYRSTLRNHKGEEGAKEWEQLSKGAMWVLSCIKEHQHKFKQNMKGNHIQGCPKNEATS